eukprot:2220003-Pleurochrysis_carterae.AAC.2
MLELAVRAEVGQPLVDEQGRSDERSERQLLEGVEVWHKAPDQTKPRNAKPMQRVCVCVAVRRARACTSVHERAEAHAIARELSVGGAWGVARGMCGGLRVGRGACGLLRVVGTAQHRRPPRRRLRRDAHAAQQLRRHTHFGISRARRTHSMQRRSGGCGIRELALAQEPALRVGIRERLKKMAKAFRWHCANWRSSAAVRKTTVREHEQEVGKLRENSEPVCRWSQRIRQDAPLSMHPQTERAGSIPVCFGQARKVQATAEVQSVIVNTTTKTT